MQGMIFKNVRLNVMPIANEKHRELELKVQAMRAQILLLSDEVKRLKALVPEDCRHSGLQLID